MENNLNNIISEDGKRLRVELVPMVTGDNPWRTRGDYIREQNRDTKRFIITIIALIISILSVVCTAITAIYTIKQAGNSTLISVTPVNQSVTSDPNKLLHK